MWRRWGNWLTGSKLLSNPVKMVLPPTTLCISTRHINQSPATKHSIALKPALYSTRIISPCGETKKDRKIPRKGSLGKSSSSERISTWLEPKDFRTFLFHSPVFFGFEMRWPWPSSVWIIVFKESLSSFFYAFLSAITFLWMASIIIIIIIITMLRKKGYFTPGANNGRR